MPTIEETISFIQKAHAGQTDKAGNDYYLHPVVVMKRLPGDVDDEVRLAALLHDVLEDTPYSRQQLSEMGYTERTLDAVELVTHKSGDQRTYAEKINGIIASANRDAIQVKLADMSENSDPARLALLDSAKREYLLEKYSAPLWKRRGVEHSSRPGR
jgi:guanosine-3',5'-bis(diphosphate) 3'-pyrophosphohydrolase